jgi:hypothetical protein
MWAFSGLVLADLEVLVAWEPADELQATANSAVIAASAPSRRREGRANVTGASGRNYFIGLFSRQPKNSDCQNLAGQFPESPWNFL